MSSISKNDWQDEAKAVMKDIQRHVLNVSPSILTKSEKHIYFNVTTLEKKDFCVELSEAGFRIVGEKYDSDDKKGKYRIFETPYSMLDNLSPAYRDSFREELVQKLEDLQREQQENEGKEEEPEEEKEENEEEKEENEEEKEENEEEKEGSKR